MKVLFKINNLGDSSIPIEIIDQVASKLESTAEIHVIALFSDESDAEIQHIDRSSLDIHCCNLAPGAEFLSHIQNLLIRIKDINPDIIHTNHTYSLWMLLYKFIDRDCGFIHTFHSDFGYYCGVAGIEARAILSLYDYIIYNSNNTRDTFPSIYKNPNQIHEVVYNGVNRNFIHGNKEVEKSDKITIMSAGRFVDEKNFKLALRGIHELVDKGYNNIEYVLVGDGHLKSDYQKLLEKYNIGEYVNLTGFLPRPEVYEWMWKSDIYLITSTYEGFCNAAVEAMFTENIIVASDIEPLRTEVIGDGGFYFKNGDVNSLVDELSYVIEEIEDLNDICESLSNRAKENFTLEKTAQNYSNIYLSRYNS